MKNAIGVGIEMNLWELSLSMKNYAPDVIKMFLIMAKQEN
jgi:hypothetical protein